MFSLGFANAPEEPEPSVSAYDDELLGFEARSDTPSPKMEPAVYKNLINSDFEVLLV